MGAEICDRTFAIVASAVRRLPPAASARSVARWITGPSASGSENGTPTSSTSAPARSSAFRISADRGRSGSPAVVNVISPGRPSARRRTNVSSIREPLRRAAKGLLHRVDILVSTTRQVHQHVRGWPKFPSDSLGVSDGVRRFERRENAFELRKRPERGKRLLVGDIRVLGAADRAQPGMFRTYGGVVQACRNRMRELDIAVRVLQHEGPGALEHAGAATRETGGVPAGRDLLPPGFDTNQAHVTILDERIEDAHGVAAPANARDNRVGQAAGQLDDLAASLPADHRLEFADHQR